MVTGEVMMSTRKIEETDGIIMLHSGISFDLKKPSPSLFNISDIAHSLSKLCRFGGHTPFFYSVAQHCVLVSDLLPLKLQLAGLLHDAAEAYIGDVTAPLKHLLPEYREIEQSIERALFSAFGIHYPLDAQVKLADELILQAEWRDFFQKDTHDATGLPKINPLNSQQARQLFLERFHDLTGA